MRHANPTFMLSKIELSELLKAWILTSLAFAIFFVRTEFVSLQDPSGFLVVFVIAALTAGVGFIVHEMAHKYVAHRFRVHGEFRSNGTMLVVSLFFAMMGFLFAAPGAVHLFGRATRKENGIIAAAGPASNMVLTVLFAPLMLLPGLVGIVGSFGVLINAILGAFNLIPFLGLDGAKVLAWSKPAYFSLVGVAAVLVVGAFTLP